MAYLPLKVGGLVIGGALGYWRGRRSGGDEGKQRSARSVASSTLWGGLAGLVLAMGLPLLVGVVHPLSWSSGIQSITTQEELDALLTDAGDRPVLVDFYSSWCAPCRALAPHMDKLARDGNIVAVVDLDNGLELAKAHRVDSIPTLLVFRNGQLVHREQGYHTLAELRALVGD